MLADTPRAAFYNENDPKTAAWLRELVSRGLVVEGHIDARDIRQVAGADCAPVSHFFAGIGGWPYALELAGWPADRPVWTGSCPCQPFSAAGKRLGTADPGHLWPEWRRLIAECRPPTIFGEQVASRAGREWLAGIRADLEALGYAVGAADLCAAGVGAPHIRQRLFWVAEPKGEQMGRTGQPRELPDGGLAISTSAGGCCGKPVGEGRREELGGPSEDGRMGDTDKQPREFHARELPAAEAGKYGARKSVNGTVDLGPEYAGEGLGAWSNFDLLPCIDRKQRRVESGTFPLAHGVPARVGRLRGYGNAIVPQVAAVFVRAFMETADGD